MLYKLTYKLQRQSSRFLAKFLKDFSRPEQKWIRDIYLGMFKSRDVKLSETARSIGGDVRLIENRLSDNLKEREISSEVYDSYLPYVKGIIQEDAFISLDISDIRKEYAKEMEYLCGVWDGSEGEVHEGYWLISLIAHNEDKERIVPLYQELYSQKAPDFESENTTILEAIERIKEGIGNKGIIVIDRGGDRRILFKKLHSKDGGRSRFLIRMNSDKRHLEVEKKRLYPEEVFKKYRYRAKLMKRKDDKREERRIRYDWSKVGIPSIDGEFTLIGVKGLGNEPLYLVTNVEVRDKNDVFFLIKGYLSRWTIEEAFRWEKQAYNLEDIRVQKYISLRNIVTILFLVFSFLTVHLILNPRMKLLFSRVYQESQRLRDDIHFLLYALSRGVSDLFGSLIPTIWSLDPPSKSLQYLTLFETLEKKS